MYDVCIIGGGPAGLTAAIYGSRAGGKLVVLEALLPGGQMGETAQIENMPGLPEISGQALSESLYAQVQSLQVPLLRERALELLPRRGWFQVRTGKSELVARRVILATGAKRKNLNIPGEAELRGKGVSWCAVCDGNFFRGKTVCVVGGGNTALEDARYLSGICKKVYVAVRRDIRGEKLLWERLREKENVEILLNTTLEVIRGEDCVTGAVIRQREKTRELPVDGVFVAIGMEPDPGLYRGLAELDDRGFIRTDEHCLTGHPGLYAAGDVRAKELKQIVTAMADGAIAGEHAVRDR